MHNITTTTTESICVFDLKATRAQCSGWKIFILKNNIDMSLIEEMSC